MREKFGDSPYIIQVAYQDGSCSNFSVGYGYPASGNCEGAFNQTDSYYGISRLNLNGSASIDYFSASPCLSGSLYMTKTADSNTLTTHVCDVVWLKWYSSYDFLSSGSSVTTSGIIGIVAGCLVALGLVGAIVFHRLKNARQKQQNLQFNATILQSANTVFSDNTFRNALWNDEVIIAHRVPRDKVKIKNLLSQGAYGEVYQAKFNGRPVAVKMLVPAAFSNLQMVNKFLAEAKITATFDHPRIVSFIGVAWDSLADVCVVLEFIDGGDLRTLLDNYLASKYAVGFNRTKATIALHICHALTYLHSLSPPVIHRDLKSKNILLNQSLEAKFSDFGISREQLDLTMTAGVGTSLWMAPKVMLGERYDDKADIFSFGVALSELDVHTMPYALAKQRSIGSNGRVIANAALLQKITTREVHVEFSDTNTRSLEELGRACVSVNANDRPSAAEALHRLHVFLSQKMR